MELKGKVALVTGGGAGIGRALSLALAKKGVRMTILDYSETSGKEVVGVLEEEHAKFYRDLEKPTAAFIRCDVANPGDLASAFVKHLDTFGRLDICINNAGIADEIPFVKDKSRDGSGPWRRTIDINLMAVIDCTRLAIQSMEAGGHNGTILNIGSASGLHPFYHMPIYGASKAGVVMFSRSLSTYKCKGIRVNVLCPEFVDTDMTKKGNPRLIEQLGGFLPMDMVIKGAFELIEDETKAGKCLWLTKRRGLEYWPSPEEKKKYLTEFGHVDNSVSHKPQANVEIVPTIPSTFEKVVVHRLDNNFRQATKIERTYLKLPIRPGHVLVKNIYAGVNASDINYSSGHYFGNEKEAGSRLPFDAGFEAVGLVVAVDDFVEGLTIGAPVAAVSFGAYAEYSVVPAKHVIPVPRLIPEVVAMLTSGLTASIGLEQAGKMESCQTVLVTAAAGGTGQFAVQLAKIAGNKVVATCGGTQKAALLRDFGVDRVIDYRKEDIKLIALDPKQFLGVKSVADAVEYLHSGQSVGKVVVCIDPSFSQVTARL